MTFALTESCLHVGLFFLKAFLSHLNRETLISSKKIIGNVQSGSNQGAVSVTFLAWAIQCGDGSIKRNLKLEIATLVQTYSTYRP